MIFSVTISDRYQSYNYVVRHEPVNRREELFIAQRGNDKVTFLSNRPLFRSKHIMRRRPDFILHESTISNMSIVNDLRLVILEHVNKLEAAGSI